MHGPAIHQLSDHSMFCLFYRVEGENNLRHNILYTIKMTTLAGNRQLSWHHIGNSFATISPGQLLIHQHKLKTQ